MTRLVQSMTIGVLTIDSTWELIMPFRSTALLALILVCGAATAQSPRKVTITDSNGHEVTPAKFVITSGTRKLGWLPGAPEALAFRETNSTLFRDGVLTLIPFDRLESLSYDAVKMTVAAKAAGVEQSLNGSTRFREINQVIVETEIDKGAAGVVAIKYRGGVAKGGPRRIAFSDAKPGEAAKGDPSFIVISDKGKMEAPERVTQLMALYRLPDGKEVLSPTITFKVSYKIRLDQIVSMTVEENKEEKGFECELTILDGTTQSLTLLTEATIDGKKAALEGFLAVVPAGFKLYPVHCIGQVSRTEPMGPVKPKPKPVDGN